jgi:hypothetical protein
LTPQWIEKVKMLASPASAARHQPGQHGDHLARSGQALAARQLAGFEGHERQLLAQSGAACKRKAMTIPGARPRVRLIGLPTDSHSSFQRGPAKAPAAIRAA